VDETMKLKQEWYRRWFTVLLVIVVLFAMTGCGMMKSYQQVMAAKRAQYPNINLTQRISLPELREDLLDLTTTLEAVHPHLYTALSQRSFQDNLEKILQSLGGNNTTTTNPAVTVRDIYLKLAPHLVALEQDYTCLLFPYDAYRDFQARNGKLFPFEVIVVAEEKLKVKTNFSSKTIAPGAEIESINGVPAKGIITTLLKYCEGGTLPLRNQRLSKNFQALLWLVYDFQEPYTISIDTRWIPISGVTNSEIQKVRRLHTASADIPDEFDYQPLGEAVGILTIPNFEEAEFSLKLKDTFTEIAQSQITDLIIDLRNNSGEGSSQVEQLIGYLWDRPYVTISGMEQKRSRQYDQQLNSLYYWWARPILRLHPATKDYFQTQVGQIAFLTMNPRNSKPVKSRFKGKIYVLIGPNTNSAGTEFASVIKDYRIGMLIGQTTGAAANEYGNPYEFILPHSYLRVSAATSYSIRPSGAKTPGGIKPDIEVKLTPDEVDSALGTDQDSPDSDPVLETTKKIIALNRKK
jgi:C-terminal processing protease CtpA/Prc